MKPKQSISNTIHKLLFVIFVSTSLVSCKKNPIQVLKKGEWYLDWNTNSFQHFEGFVEFKKNGQGEFVPNGASQPTLFVYTINGDKASFQWYNPSFQNTIHEFNIVTVEDKRQVWEETTPNKGSLFIITK